jgi:hypothetical protein
MDIDISPEFVRLSHCFYQGSAEMYPDRAAWIATAIGGANFNDQARARLGAFMDELLAKCGDAELEEAWRSADANYGFRGPDAMRQFLTQVRQMLDQPRDVLRRLSAEGRKQHND